MSNSVYRLRKGRIPLLISMPHVGTVIPPDVESTMTDAARRRDDTDWHLERLYDWAGELGASLLVPTCSRYVIDLNRPPDGASLYPGQDTTPICPVDSFDRAPLYASGHEPDAAEIERRLKTYWHPYHDALGAELERLRQAHGVALLWDAHSIRSVVPRFFDGRLPDFNLGTAHGSSCAPGLGEELLAVVASAASAASDAPRYTAVLNGRFVGGYITRQYGDPARGVHAVQLELSQVTYMQESPPYAFDPARAQAVQPVLRALLDTFLGWRPRLG